MTGEILDFFLTPFNHHLLRANRSIILLMDNAECHPHHLKEKFSNIKIVFLPANTTSTLQPLDLGIIQNFKCRYRKFLLRYVVAQIDHCVTASDVVGSVNLLKAIRWVAQAWDMVQSITVSRCFRKAGILTASMAVPSRADDEENDPFNEVDADTDIQNLIERTMTNEECCSGTEYVSGDDCLPVCLELDDDKWDDHFMANIAGAQECDNEDEEGRSDNESDREDQAAIPQLKSFKEAIASLEQIQHFLECHGMSVGQMLCLVL